MTRDRSERGTMLIEFSLLILVLMLLALGVFDFGLAIQQGLSISAAANAGAEYGATEGNANDTAGMSAAASNAAKWVSGTMTATATTFCICSAGSTTLVSCSGVCNLYDPPIQYVQVTTNSTIPVLFRFPGLPVTIPLSGASTLRAH